MGVLIQLVVNKLTLRSSRHGELLPHVSRAVEVLPFDACL